MAGEFGKFIDEKRRGRGPDGGDILLKDIAKAMGATHTYLSDIVKGRRNPPEMFMLLKISDVVHFSPEEQAKMFDLAGRDRMKLLPIFLNTSWMRICLMFAQHSGKLTTKASEMISGSRSMTQSAKRSDPIVW